MKLSSYYKSQENIVELVTDYKNINEFDKVFISKVFTDTEIPEGVLNLPNIEYGGTGFFYDKAPPLPPEIEHIMPDYHLYDDWVKIQIENGVKPKKLSYYTDYSIGFTCYDKQTEVLTKSGWKYFKDVTYEDEIITLNTDTNNIEYHYPKEVISVPYKGTLLHFKNKYIDIMVTPNHNMYVNKNKKYELIRADIIKNYYQYQFKKDGVWKGKEQENFYFNEKVCWIHTQTIDKVNMDLWLEFLGYYLSEGSTQYKFKTHSYIIKISQKKKSRKSILKGDVYAKIKQCIERIGYNFYENESEGFYISNKQLYLYLEQFGLQHERFIPPFIKDLSPRQINIFLDAYTLGDGTLIKSKNNIITKGIISSSKSIMDDLQELYLKIGSCGDIKCYTKKGNISFMKRDQRYIEAKHNSYTIYQNNYYKEPMYRSKVENSRYDDYVYCVEVPNHVIYIRRNEIAAWCGNTRGCIRQCSFCVNKNYKQCTLHSPLSEFLDESRPYICLLDDNILACKDWRIAFDELIASGKRFQFKQGLDERLLTDEKCDILFNKSKWIGDYIFAFDNIKDKDIIENKLKMIRKHTNKTPKFYVFCGYNHNNPDHYDIQFWSNDITDLFERIKILMRYQCLPYIMRYKDYELSPYRGTYINLARWCNQPNFFKKKSYREFCLANQESTKSAICSAMHYLQVLENDCPDIAQKYFDMKFEMKN